MSAPTPYEEQCIRNRVAVAREFPPRDGYAKSAVADREALVAALDASRAETAAAEKRRETAQASAHELLRLLGEANKREAAATRLIEVERDVAQSERLRLRTERDEAVRRAEVAETEAERLTLAWNGADDRASVASRRAEVAEARLGLERASFSLHKTIQTMGILGRSVWMNDCLARDEQAVSDYKDKLRALGAELGKCARGDGAALPPAAVEPVVPVCPECDGEGCGSDVTRGPDTFVCKACRGTGRARESVASVAVGDGAGKQASK